MLAIVSYSLFPFRFRFWKAPMSCSDEFAGIDIHVINSADCLSRILWDCWEALLVDYQGGFLEKRFPGIYLVRFPESRWTGLAGNRRSPSDRFPAILFSADIDRYRRCRWRARNRQRPYYLPRGKGRRRRSRNSKNRMKSMVRRGWYRHRERLDQFHPELSSLVRAMFEIRETHRELEANPRGFFCEEDWSFLFLWGDT